MPENDKPDQEYPCAFIPDGYTTPSTIAGVKGAYPPCTLTHRPFRGIERSYWYAKAYAPQGAQKGEIDEMLAKRISEWDLKLADGKVAAITPGNIASLDGRLYTAILDKVMGIDRERELAEIISGTKNQTPEEDDAKN